jgi:hypothetical protein
MNTGLPATRQEAIALKSTKYYTGKACHKGHMAYRYTNSGTCSTCHSEKASADWKDGKRPSKELRGKINKTWNASEKAKSAKQRWKEKDPKKAWAIYATGGAKTRTSISGVPFEITSEYILSICPDVCPVFKTPFVFIGNKKSTPESATIDRLDPTKGYTIGNIAIISMKANTIKNAFTSSDIFKVAEWLQTKGY